MRAAYQAGCGRTVSLEPDDAYPHLPVKNREANRILVRRCGACNRCCCGNQFSANHTWFTFLCNDDSSRNNACVHCSLCSASQAHSEGRLAMQAAYRGIYVSKHFHTCCQQQEGTSRSITYFQPTLASFLFTVTPRPLSSIAIALPASKLR